MDALPLWDRRTLPLALPDMPLTLFPLHGVTSDGSCACPLGPACDSTPGKHPSIFWRGLEPGQQVRGGAGHGLATGAKSGLFVLDVDVKPATGDRPAIDGFASLARLGDLPDTYTVLSPSGSKHFYFKHPGKPIRNSVGQLGPGLDIRGDGGFVVMAGSPHALGGLYKEEARVPIAEAPEWLLAWPGLYGRERIEGCASAPRPVDLSTTEGRRRLRLGVEACATYPASIEGRDGSGALWNLAVRLVRELELPLDVASEIVTETFNVRCLAKDGRSPFPWTQEQIEHKLEDARDGSDRPTGIAPKGWDLGAEARKPTPAPPTKRRQKDPAHVHPFHLGDISNVPATKTTLGHVIEVLSGSVPEWAGVLQYDEFRDRIVAIDPPIPLQAERTCFAEHDVTSVRAWFELAMGRTVSKDMAWDATIAIARQNGFHPVREYLEGLPAGDPTDLDQAAKVFFGSDDPLDRVLVRKFMLGAVRRILNPGEKVDTMLVLVGPQGKGKSTFVQHLFTPAFSSEDLSDIRGKDAMIGLAGKWAIEVAELDRILRQDPETVKAFLSRCVDPYRAPYERVSTDHPRQCVYVGTTNKDDFLRDPTGERRYWIVKISQVLVDAVLEWRDRMWASAYALANVSKKEEPHWLTEEEGEALKARCAAYKGEDGWLDTIEAYCTGRDFVRVEELWKHLGGTVDQLDKGKVHKITDILRELGCEKALSGGKRNRTRGWSVPACLASELPSEKEDARRKGADLLKGILEKMHKN